MNCSRVRGLLADYTAEIPDVRTRLALEAHLSGCESCRRELDALRAAMALVERYGLRQPPPGLFEGVRFRIEADSARQRPAWWAFLTTRPARAAAMALAMAAVVLGLFYPVRVPLPDNPIHPTGVGSAVAAGDLADSIRHHAMSAARGPLADRVAWEAMAQLALQDESRAREGTRRRP